MLPREGLAHKEHISVHGTKPEFCQAVADALKSYAYFTTRVNGKSVCDRYECMQKTFDVDYQRDAIHSVVSGDITEVQEPLLHIRERRVRIFLFSAHTLGGNRGDGKTERLLLEQDSSRKQQIPAQGLPAMMMVQKSSRRRSLHILSSVQGRLV